jgi:hypothetical protein
MKKLVWLLVLALLVVPAFAANLSTSNWIGVGFHTRFVPYNGQYYLIWGTWASGNINFSLSGSSNLGSVNANVELDLPVATFSNNWVSGTITFSKVFNTPLTVSFHKGTLSVSGTKLVSSLLSGSTGISVVADVAPVKVTVGVAPNDDWWVPSSGGMLDDFTLNAVVTARADVSVNAPVALSVYGLINKETGTMTVTNWAVGGSVTPVTTPVSLTVYGEAAKAPEQLVGATVKALGGKVTVDANYKVQAQKVKVSVSGDNLVPNVSKVYVEYNTAETYTLFGYVSASLPVPVGSLSLGAAFANGPDTLFGGFGKWSVSLGGGVTHDLLVGYSFNYDNYSSNGFNRRNLTEADNLWGFDVRGKVYAESKLMIGF